MGKLLLGFVLVLAALGGGGAYLATQPAGGVEPVQPSSRAVITAEGKIFAAFAAAGAEAMLVRHPVRATVHLTDEELTSLVASRLAQSSSSLSNVVLVGSSEGVFRTTADLAWNGLTFHVFAAGTIGIGGDGAIHIGVREADLGRLPLPASVVDAIVAQNAGAATVNVPSGISDLAVQPVAGGATVSGMVSPEARRLAP